MQGMRLNKPQHLASTKCTPKQQK